MAKFAALCKSPSTKRKTQFSKLIAAAERGEEVIIARRDTRVARLVAEKPQPLERVLGFLASQQVQLEGFFDPGLEAQIAADFYPEKENGKGCRDV